MLWKGMPGPASEHVAATMHPDRIVRNTCLCTKVAHLYCW